MTIDPPTVSVLPGGSATLTATARGRNGVALPGRIFTFQSSDISIVQVSNLGYVTGLKQGTATITGSSEGKSASVVVTVSPAPVATLAVTLVNPALYVTQTTQANADLRDANGQQLTGRQVVWTSSNTAVATVSQTGLVTALLPGTADITGANGGKSAKATVTVALVPVSTINVSLAQNARFVGQTTTASAATLDSIGGTLTGRPIVWASSNPSVATVTQTGAVSALAPGSTNISASAEGKVGNAALTVTLVPVAKIHVTLGAPSQFVGQKTTATVTLLDANNNVLTGPRSCADLVRSGSGHGGEFHRCGDARGPRYHKHHGGQRWYHRRCAVRCHSAARRNGCADVAATRAVHRSNDSRERGVA